MPWQFNLSADNILDISQNQNNFFSLITVELYNKIKIKMVV